MCEFHESTCNGFGDIWWTDNPIYFSSIDYTFKELFLTSECANRLSFDANSVATPHALILVHESHQTANTEVHKSSNATCPAILLNNSEIYGTKKSPITLS